MSRRLMPLFLAGSLGVGLALPALADDEKAERKAREADEPVNVFLKAATREPGDAGSPSKFSNEDLEQRVGGVIAPETPDAPDEPAEVVSTWQDDPEAGRKALQAIADAGARRTAVQRRIVQVEAELAAAEARLTAWDKTILAVKNPLLPRPLPPEDPEQRKRWEAMDGMQRAAYAKEQRDRSVALVEAKRRELTELRTLLP